VQIEGATIDELSALSIEDQDSLLAFGRPIAFRIGSAEVLAEFNREASLLSVNLAHVEGGGEGILVTLWKLIERYAQQRGYTTIQWNVHALTCAKPNARLQRFLRMNGFTEVEHPVYGRILTRQTVV